TKKLLDGSQAAVVTLGTTGATNIASNGVTAGPNTVAGTYQIAVTQQGLKAQAVASNAFTAATNIATTTNGATAALTGNATISQSGANTTNVGTYVVTVTQQGVKGSIAGAVPGAAGTTNGTLTFNHGLLSAATTIAVATTDTVGNIASTINADATL